MNALREKLDWEPGWITSGWNIFSKEGYALRSLDGYMMTFGTKVQAEDYITDHNLVPSDHLQLVPPEIKAQINSGAFYRKAGPTVDEVVAANPDVQCIAIINARPWDGVEHIRAEYADEVLTRRIAAGKGFRLEITGSLAVLQDLADDLQDLFDTKRGTQGDEYEARYAAGAAAESIRKALHKCK